MNDGGPCFPSTRKIAKDPAGVFIETTHFPGMSLRDYFIAHAPPVPKWFHPEMSEARPEAAWPDGKPRGDIPPNWQAIKLWDKQEEYERYMQWPIYWADEMIRRTS